MKAHANMIAALLLAICLLLPCYSQAQAEDFRVNDDYSGAYQGYSHIATDLDGNFVVSWYDKRAGQNDIFVQFFDHVGNRIGSNLLVNDDAAGAEQLKPSLMRSQSGETYVAWQDFRITGYPFNGDIYLQKFDASGNPSGTNERVNGDYGVATQAWQDIAVADNGQFVIVWEDNRYGGYDIYAQRYNADGSKAANNIKVNDDTSPAYQHNPKVAIAANGSFVVTWYDNRSGSDNIMAQRYSAQGTPLGINFLVNEIFSGNKCVFPDIACDADGNFTIVWIDYRNGKYPDNPDVYGRRYLADGNARGMSFKINTDGSKSAQAEATIGMDYAGNFIVAWRDDRDGDFDIYAQYFNQSGATVGSNYKVNTDDGSATQSFPNVTMDGINIYYTWTDDRNGDFDVYATISGYGDPSLVVTPKTLNFAAQAGGATPASQLVQVRNIGYGILEWSASSADNWISVSPTTGAAPDSFQVYVSPSGLAGGTHQGKIYLTDQLRAISDSVDITFDVNQPTANFCVGSKQTPIVARVDGQTTSQTYAINNCGDALLSWSVAEAPPYLTLSDSSGTEGDSVTMSAAENSQTGQYRDTLWLSAPDCSNSPYPIETHCNIYPGDSLWLEPANVLRGETVEVPLHLTNYIPTSDLNLMLSCETGSLSLDSLELMLPGTDMISYDKSAASDSVSIHVDASAMPIIDGNNAIALLHVTADDSTSEGEHEIGIEATIIDTLGFTSQFSGVVGTIEVSSQTDVRPVAVSALPTKPFLLQNYPNPFNLSTEITYGLDKERYVRLDVFDLLGRQVANLRRGYQPAGAYRATWDGRDNHGAVAASGIYFIRMTTAGTSLAVKAVLLK